MSTTPPSVEAAAAMQALLNGPAAKPPPGVLPNFVDPPDLSAAVIAVMSTCLIVTFLVLSIRSYTKLRLMHSVACEDYVMILAWLGQVVFTVPSILSWKHGGGRHMWDVQLKEVSQMAYWINVGGIVYSVTVCLIKVSILLQFLMIFVPNHHASMGLYIAIQATMASVILYYILNTVLMIGLCNPRKKIWEPSTTPGHCLNADALYFATGVFNILSDFALLILPMIPIWRLQMPLRKKAMMIAIFAAGFGACVTSIFRTFYTFRIARSPDITYNVIMMGLWSWGEVSIGIVVSCLPIMPKFFRHVGDSKYGSFFSLRSRAKTTGKRDATGVINHTIESAPVKQKPDISGSWSDSTEVFGKEDNITWGEREV